MHIWMMVQDVVNILKVMNVLFMTPPLIPAPTPPIPAAIAAPANINGNGIIISSLIFI